MSNLTHLGSGFDCSILDINQLINIPTVHHVYGSNLPTKDELAWMTYSPQGGHQGQIGFLRNCGRFFPEMAQYTVDFLSARIDIPFDLSQVTILRTVGSIKPHVDEGRLACINIGLHNSDAAITKFYPVGSPTEESRMQLGHAYLLDVKVVHGVFGAPDAVRYLVSYSMDIPYVEAVTKVL